jgi:hypothetical protein
MDIEERESDAEDPEIPVVTPARASTASASASQPAGPVLRSVIAWDRKVI